MPSLIPNYIARLRTHSQSTATSSSHSASRSNSTAGPPTPGPELARLAAGAPAPGQSTSTTDPAPHEQVARKIHPDLGALLDEDAPQENVDEVLGPRPPRGRSLSAEQLARIRPDSVPQREEAEESSGRPPGPDAPPRSPLLSRILSTPLLRSSPPSTPTLNTDADHDTGGVGMHWSTFGRRRPRAAVGEFGSLHRRGSGSASAHSKASRRRPQQSVTPTVTRTSSARTSTPSRAQTVASAETPPSQSDSPAGTISSSSGSKAYSAHSHSQSVRSRRPPLAHPETILDTDAEPQTPAAAPFSPTPGVASPLAARQTLDDSPHTFGRATPQRRPYPRLGGAFATTPPTRRNREPPSTYPPRTRPSTISFPSLPARPRARSRPRHRPAVEDVFHAGRRTSADWSAAEAVRAGGGQTWQATVSREMVRLALAGGGAAAAAVSVPLLAGGDVEGSVETGEVGALREGAKNPTLFGSIGEDRRRFFRATRGAGGRKVPDASAPAESPASALKPAFSVSPPSGASASTSRTADGGARGGGGLAPHFSVTAPTPSASPSGSRVGTMSDPTPGAGSNAATTSSAKSHGKRKIVDAEDEAQPDESGTRPRLGILSGNRETSTRISDASHAPSSFRHSKRIRLSTPSHSPPHTHPQHSLSSPPHSPPASPHPHSRPPSSLRTLPNPRSLSQSSIPLRAIVSPRPPSIDRRSAYHMRDPALPPPRRQSMQWTGSARKSEDQGRRSFPLQGWAFVLGFVLFPAWWVAAIVPVAWGWGRWTVRDGKGAWAAGEALTAREEWEYDVAHTWRRRCRLMSVLGLFLYVPLIVLLAILVPRT